MHTSQNQQTEGKMMTTGRTRTMVKALCMAGILTAGAATLAEANVKSNCYSKGFGDNMAGASSTFCAEVRNQMPLYTATAVSAVGEVKLLNKTGKFFVFNATADNNYGVRRVMYKLDVAGINVDTGLKSTSFTWDKGDLRTLFAAEYPFTIGPVPVFVRGDVGTKAQINYNFAFDGANVGLNGVASASANGSASGGIKGGIVQPTLKATLELLKASLSSSLAVSPSSWSGLAGLLLEPLTIDFSVILDFLWPLPDLSYSIAKYSFASEGKYLLALSKPAWWPSWMPFPYS